MPSYVFTSSAKLNGKYKKCFKKIICFDDSNFCIKFHSHKITLCLQKPYSTLSAQQLKMGKTQLKQSGFFDLPFFLTSTGISYPFYWAGDILRNACFPAFARYWMSSQCVVRKSGYYLEPEWSLEEVVTKFWLL